MRIPLWLKCAYTLLAAVVVVVYWRDLGPANFLWFSDIALILMVPALWLESRLLASTMAVSVLFLELSWVLDFVSGGNITGLAEYMFADQAELALYLRILSSLFHLALPPTILFMLVRLGYDRRALPVQILLAAVVLPISYVVTDTSANLNWVLGPGQPQEMLPPLVYLGVLFVAFIVLIYIPSHLVLRRLFPAKK